MEHSTSSRKVSVEYTDPSGIYAVISEDLQKHLPLRNLYWNSATRPLRSISSLHIDLVPAGTPNPSVTLNGNTDDAEDRGVSWKSRPGSSGGVKKERRHQIPGLRQTPYLKLFFLRCSDVESYRTTERKQIREWIKENTPPTQSTASVNTQEFHDAFECLIVHVILPDDGRSISRASNAGKSETRNGHRGCSAVTEKLRADFNGSSKTAVDRVALVQITRDSQTVQGQGSLDGWEDFVSKAKSLILSSFDLRVTQYEEDIRERDSQRNIPGWNFNTFFVLKEGLARGFESVGLLEDALTGYRELAVGLNSMIEDHGNEGQHRGHFRDFTEDLSVTLKQALQAEESQKPHERKAISPNSVTRDTQVTEDRDALGANILDADRKPFREMILANEISVFDFQCYLFAREVSLLLRLANATEPSNLGKGIRHRSVDVASKTAPPDSQDLLLLAEVCRLAVEFFSAASRMIRDDLRSSIHPLSKGHATASSRILSAFEGPIEDMVASWTYSACQSILGATKVSSLEVQLQPLLGNLKPPEKAYTGANGSSTTQSGKELPRRTSSLPMRKNTSPRPSPDKFPAITSLDAVRLLPPTSSQRGTQELAAQQAELVALKRRVMASVGRRSNIVSIRRASSVSPSSLSADDLEDISLDDTLTDSQQTGKMMEDSHRSPADSLHNKDLGRSLQSERVFCQTYEEFTVMALALNVLGDRRRSAESLTTDLAVMRYRMKDYSSAASYFHQLASFYYKNDWTRLEIPMLDLFAQCLKHLDRKQDFCRTGLQILAKTTSRRGLIYTPAASKSQQSTIDVRHYLLDVINASRGLERPLSAPLHQHFDDVYLVPYIRHFDKRDGFQMSLRLRNLTLAAVDTPEIRVKLVSIDEDQRCDMWLNTEVSVVLQPGLCDVTVQSNVTCPAWYRLERIDIRSANIVFTYDATTPTNNAFFGNPSTSEGMDRIARANMAPILVWPSEKALEAKLSLCASIHLGKLRSIEIIILSGRNDISQWRLGLRACSAGLRLHTADADIVTGHCSALNRSQAGSLEFGSVGAETKTVVRIPYGIESDLTEIKARVEIFYTVNGQDYQYNHTGELPIQLPLSVNVQDNFQARSLFSNFKIDTANSIPIRIRDYTMHSTNMFQVFSPPLGSDTLTVFARHPLSLVAKVRRSHPKTTGAQTQTLPDKILMLQLRYACLDQEARTAVEDKLSEALWESEFRDLSHLLVTALGKALGLKLSVQDYETIGLLGEIQMSSLEQHLWDSVLNALHPDTRDKVARWLKEWQAVGALPDLYGPDD
ncbi:MAG: hypothetical protein Q9166_005543 [cf. Caloplaca sp. 2 TL-2023]